MIIPILSFLFFVFTYVISYLITDSRLRKELSNEGPGPMLRSLRKQNSTIFIVILVFVIFFAIAETIFSALHDVMLDLFYLIGDPLGVFPFAWGGGISLLLYIAILISVYFSIVLGCSHACKKYEHSRHLSTGDLLKMF